MNSKSLGPPMGGGDAAPFSVPGAVSVSASVSAPFSLATTVPGLGVVRTPSLMQLVKATYIYIYIIYNIYMIVLTEYIY